MVSAPLDRADAIVVLSGSATFDERAAWAATLYNEGRAPKIILTSDNAQGGWSTTLQRNPFYWERSVNELRRLGVPREKIEVLPQPVSSTYDEGVLLRQHSEACGFRSILVVTSPYHSRRALWTLRRVFNNSGVAIGMAAVPPGRQSPWPTTWWGHIVGWEMVPGEYLKMLYYHLRY